MPGSGRRAKVEWSRSVQPETLTSPPQLSPSGHDILSLDDRKASQVVVSHLRSTQYITHYTMKCPLVPYAVCVGCAIGESCRIREMFVWVSPILQGPYASSFNRQRCMFALCGV